MTPRHPDGADGRRTVARAAAWTRCPVIFSPQHGDTVHDDDGCDGARLIREMLFHTSRIYVLFLQWNRSRDDDLQPRFTPSRARRNPREKHAPPVQCAREDVVSPKSLS